MVREQGLTELLERVLPHGDPSPEKLFEQVAAGVYLTDARLWRIWQDERDSARVLRRLPAWNGLGHGGGCDGRTRSWSYFDAHCDDFSDRQGRAVLSLISLARPITATDSAATRQRAVELRNEILGGVLFDTVARRESADSVSAARTGSWVRLRVATSLREFERVAFTLRAR